MITAAFKQLFFKNLLQILVPNFRNSNNESLLQASVDGGLVLGKSHTEVAQSLAYK